MKIFKFFSLFLAIVLFFVLTSACDGEDGDIKDTKVAELLEGLDPETIDLIVELAKDQRGNLKGDGPFEGLVWADSESTYCDRFVSAVITVATGGNVSEGYQSGYKTAYNHYISHKSLIKSGEPAKGAIVYFDKNIEENGGCGHVGIFDGEGNIISVVDKEQGVLILPLESFKASNLGWITFENYKGEVLSAAILSPAEEQKTQSGEVTITELSIPPPSKPSLTSPYNWYQSLGSAPTLIWKGDENSIYYYVIVNSSNTGDIKSGWINSTSWRPNLPNQNYIYSWKVKAKNSQGVEGEWSEKRNFSVASTALKFEGDVSFSPPSPSSADMIKIFASTTGWGGVGVTLRVSVNTAPDGSSNGEWRILKELGVPKFNEVDAPEWHTNGWSNGTYRIRVEAKGPGDPHWQNPAVIEATYTLVGKSVISEEVIEEIIEGPYTVCSPFVLPVDDKYLETAGVSKGKGIMTSSYFFLDEGAEIKAVISGEITSLIHDSKPFEDCPAFENFFLEDDNGIFCSYLLLGKTFIEEGDKVSQGQTIAISSGGGFGFHLGNLQIYTERIFGEGPNDYEYMDLLR